LLGSAAENLPLEEESVQLITASQSFHFFAIDEFYAEVDRILIKNGFIACFSYLAFPLLLNEKMTEKQINLDTLLKKTSRYPTWNDFNKKILSLVDKGYNDAKLPFNGFIRIDDIVEEGVWTWNDITGHVETLPSYQEFKVKNEAEAILFIKELSEAVKSLFNSCSEVDLSQISS